MLENPDDLFTSHAPYTIYIIIDHVKNKKTLHLRHRSIRIIIKIFNRLTVRRCSAHAGRMANVQCAFVDGVHFVAAAVNTPAAVYARRNPSNHSILM